MKLKLTISQLYKFNNSYNSYFITHTSPLNYVYCANNPIMFVDPDDEEVQDSEVKNYNPYQLFLKTKAGSSFYNLYQTGKFKDIIVTYKFVKFAGQGQSASGGI